MASNIDTVILAKEKSEELLPSEKLIVETLETKHEEQPVVYQSSEDDDNADGDSAILSSADGKNEAHDKTAAFKGESSDTSLSNKEEASMVEATVIDESTCTCTVTSAIKPPEESSSAEKIEELQAAADEAKPESELVLPSRHETKLEAKPSRKRKLTVALTAIVDDSAKSLSSEPIDEESKILPKKIKINRKSCNLN